MLDLTPILPWFYATLALVLTGLAAWMVANSSGWLKAHATFLNASAREKIVGVEQSALNAGVDYVMAYAQREGGSIHPQVNSWLLRQGAQVAIDHASGLLADNGATPDDVANKILAKLPNIATTPDISKAIPWPGNGYVDARPLPPLAVSSLKSVAQQEHFSASKNSTL